MPQPTKLRAGLMIVTLRALFVPPAAAREKSQPASPGYQPPECVAPGRPVGAGPSRNEADENAIQREERSIQRQGDAERLEQERRRAAEAAAKAAAEREAAKKASPKPDESQPSSTPPPQ